jgi:hypothetical protein
MLLEGVGTDIKTMMDGSMSHGSIQGFFVVHTKEELRLCKEFENDLFCASRVLLSSPQTHSSGREY